jgi:hypothetical protein
MAVYFHAQASKKVMPAHQRNGYPGKDVPWSALKRPTNDVPDALPDGHLLHNEDKYRVIPINLR